MTRGFPSNKRKRVIVFIFSFLFFASSLSVVIYSNTVLNLDSVGNGVSNSGHQNVLVIPIYFPELYPSRSIDDIILVMNQADEYVKELSYGKTWLDTIVLNWTCLDESAEYYGTEAIFDYRDSSDSYGINLMVKHTINKVDCIVNFQEYDRILIYHAGYSTQSNGASGDSTKEKWMSTCHLPVYILTNDFTLINSVSVVAEFAEELPSIGAIVHELGHDFGADDLYGPEHGPDIGNWGLMSSGNHLDDSNTPCHMCAYTKLDVGFLNWSTQVVPITNGTYTFELNSISVNAEGFYAAKYDIGNRRYYLIEARTQHGYDSALSQFGIVVYIIDENINDSQRGRVLLANDSRFTIPFRAYGVGEFFIDYDTSFGVRVLNETDNGYYVEITTSARLVWQRLTLVDHLLEDCDKGAMATMYNGSMYLAISGYNVNLEIHQINVFKSNDRGFSWKLFFESPTDHNRINPIIVTKRLSQYTTKEKPFLFCETAYSTNHTIEGWDLDIERQYNLTELQINARNPSVISHHNRFFLTYEIISETTIAIALSESTSMSFHAYPRTIVNGSSPSLSKMGLRYPYGHKPYLVYISGGNKSYRNEVWIQSFSGDERLRVHSDHNNVSNPCIAINKHMNLTMITFEIWTRGSGDIYRRDGGLILVNVSGEEPVITKRLDIKFDQPLGSAPIVTWGIHPEYEEVFYVAYYNGTTCCVILDNNASILEITERRPRYDFPHPHLIESHLHYQRWSPLLVCEFESRIIFVNAYNFDEDAQYHYYPTPFTLQETFDYLSIDEMALLCLYFALPLLIMFSSSGLVHRSKISFGKKVMKKISFLGGILLTAVFFNYIFATLFSTPIIFIINMFLGLVFIVSLIFTLDNAVSGTKITNEN